MSQQIDERAIRRRVEKRLKQREALIIHIVVSVAVSVFMIVLWPLIGNIVLPLVAGDGDVGFFTTLFQLPVPLLVAASLAFSVVIHSMVYFFETRGEDMRERAVQRAIERERQRVYGDADLEKPKRRARLSDDGEIVYDDEETAGDAEERREAKARRS